MKDKLVYWIPVVGMIVSLYHYRQDNGMDNMWNYYQAVMLMGLIATLTFFFA